MQQRELCFVAFLCFLGLQFEGINAGNWSLDVCTYDEVYDAPEILGDGLCWSRRYVRRSGSSAC